MKTKLLMAALVLFSLGVTHAAERMKLQQCKMQENVILSRPELLD